MEVQPTLVLLFFDVFKAGKDKAPIWIITLVSMIAITLNESAVDSFQNSLTCTVVSLAMSTGFNVSITHARIASVFINVPLMIVGCLPGLSITSLYLIMNILTTTSTLPIFMGLLPQFDNYIHGSSVLFGCSFSLASVIVYGYLSTGKFLYGIYRYFYEVYAWEPFVIALVASVVGTFLWAFLESLVLQQSFKSSEETKNHRNSNFKLEQIQSNKYQSLESNEVIHDWKPPIIDP